MITRRRMFGFLAAPAIVRATSLMPVKALPLTYEECIDWVYWTSQEALLKIFAETARVPGIPAAGAAVSVFIFDRG